MLKVGAEDFSNILLQRINLVYSQIEELQLLNPIIITRQLYIQVYIIEKANEHNRQSISTLWTLSQLSEGFTHDKFFILFDIYHQVIKISVF